MTTIVASAHGCRADLRHYDVAQVADYGVSGHLNSIGPRTLETDATFCPLPPAGEGDQYRVTIAAAHI